MEIREEIDSGHYPLVVSLKGGRGRKRGREGKEEGQVGEYGIELCGNKKKEENERWERKVEGAKNEGQVWEIVNRERKKWKGVNKGIEMREWEEYFKELLGGVEERVVRGKGKGERRRRGIEMDLNREEIRKVIRNLKDGKAMGMDGFPNEV
ncbi:hypothetical protein ALC57_03066 [Trachymyrmex cornetzi]|uniref:Uncharacterized protein n=1 Tax=Trachymyrmex cornetzi TaxID=471704 RepID=A0A151JN44_9HYME|nr:hypothetical protein ALC57_03066 [Trachymyrmex cornetzi]